MNARKISAVVVALVLALAIPFTAQANTAPNGPDTKPAAAPATNKAAALSKGKAALSKGRPDVGSNFVGVAVWINIPTASLFQCPSDGCNQGIANEHNWPQEHDLISDICYIPGSSTPWGGEWDLVYNHANGHVGFISSVFLSDIGNGLTGTTC